MVRTFEQAFVAGTTPPGGEAPVPARTGFFAWVEGAPAEGYRAPRTQKVSLTAARARGGRATPMTILTGDYGSFVLRPLLDRHGFGEVKRPGRP